MHFQKNCRLWHECTNAKKFCKVSVMPTFLFRIVNLDSKYNIVNGQIIIP
jgi:hypothetical protein